jgi:Bacterial Ig-like domain (group 3)
MRWRRAMPALIAAAACGTLTATAVTAVTAGPAAGAVRGARAAPALAGAATAPSGHWGPARQIPLTGLNAKGGGRIEALSCASPGNCTAGGSYVDQHNHDQVFVVSEVHGTWEKPTGIPGVTDAGGGSFAEVRSLSCPTAGNCAAAGGYDDKNDNSHPFIAESKHGTWGKPVPLDFGSTQIELGNSFEATSVSCPTPGNCTAGLFVSVLAPGPVPGAAADPFVVDEVNGVWHAAQAVPDAIALNDGLDGGIISVSCSSPGNCLAGGFYTHDSRITLIATETNGVWGAGTELPGIRRLVGFGSDSNAVISSVSCLPSGDCAVTGTYDGGATDGFVGNEADGLWTVLPIFPPNSSMPIAGSIPTVNGVSCAAPVGCAVVGRFVAIGGSQAFVFPEFAGSTDDTLQIPGTATASRLDAEADVVACVLTRCVTAGIFENTSGHFRVFTSDEAGGTWGTARQIGGIPANDTDAELLAASCGAPGHCAIGGFFQDASGVQHAFVADESPATTTRLALSHGKITFGHEQAERLAVTVTPRTGGTPSGKVKVKAGSATLCTITLANGNGACTLARAKLRPGSYKLTATYGGDGVYATSTSAKKTLTVSR